MSHKTEIKNDADRILWVENTVSRILDSEFPDGDLMARTVAELSIEEFILGALAADWASYTATLDRAELPRMASVIKSFPEGFRVYFAKMANGDDLPVGYTGWYPISREVFDTLDRNPSEIKHRGFMKPIPVEATGNHLYLFNYSITPALIGTRQSSDLIKDFALSIAGINKDGMAAVTVSEHGARIAQKFGMKCSGQMTHDGDIENVYTARFDL